MTPYVKNEQQLQSFKTSTLEYVKWFIQECGGHPILVKNNKTKETQK